MEVCKIIVGDFKANCYIVYNEKSNKAIVIDPGDDYFKIESELIKNNLYVCAILLTHGHFDHIGALSEFANQKIPIYIHIDDADKLVSKNNLAYMFNRTVKICSANMIFSGEVCDFNIGGFNVKAIHTPGHSKGSVSYLINDYLFTGDTLFRGGCGRIDFPTGSQIAMMQSLRKIKQLTFDADVYPGHGPQSKLSLEKRNNPYLSF